MHERIFSLMVVSALAAGSLPAALVTFSDRTAWGNNVTLASGLASTGIDFTSVSTCGNLGCPGDAQVKQYTGVSPVTMTFSSFLGFTIQGFIGGLSSGATKLAVFDKNFAGGSPTPDYRIDGNEVNYASTRNTTDGSGVKLRINLPANIRTFGFNVSTGCYITGSCSDGDNYPGTVNLTTSAGDIAAVSVPDTSSTVGEFAFFGATSDTDIAWVDFVPSGSGAVIITRIVWGVQSEPPPPPPPAPTPEPASVLVAGLGLILVLQRYWSRRGATN